MNASRLFASTVAAAMVAGTIGLVYAQTGTTTQDRTNTSQTATPDSSQPATVNRNLDIQRQGGSTGNVNRESTGSTANETRNMANERVARADRN